MTFGVLYGGYVGAETGFLIGESVEQTEGGHTVQGIAPGLLGGMAVGTATAALLALGNDPSPEAQALLYTGSLNGVFYGAQVGRALVGPSAPGRVERIHAAGLAGSMLGVGVAALAGDRASSALDQTVFTLSGAVGWVAGTGLNDLAGLGVSRSDPNDDGVTDEAVWDERPRAAVSMGSAALLSGLGVLANRTGVRPGLASTSLSLGHGAWIGGWSPLLFDDNPDTKQITGGLRVGLGLGYGSALLMSALGEPSGRSAGLQTAGWAAASALGAGIPLSIEAEGPVAAVVGPMLIAGVGGQLLGAAVSPYYDELNANDGFLMGTLAAWTGYQAIGWGLYGEVVNTEGRQPLGYALSAAGAGSLLTLGLTPFLDVDPSGSVLLLSGGGWGSWYGAWGSQLAGLNADDTWLVTLSAGNGALLATGIAQAAGWAPSWRAVGAIDGLGLVGAAAGGLAGVVVLYDPDNLDPLIISTLTGSTLGLAVGGVLAALSDEDRTAGLRMPAIHGWRGGLAAVPLAGRDGSTGVMVRLDMREVR